MQLLKPVTRLFTGTQKAFTPQRYSPGSKPGASLMVSDELQKAVKSISYSQMVQDFINDGGYGQPLYSEEQLESAYKTSVYLFAAMRRVANLASELKIVGEYRRESEWERLPEGNALNRIFDEAGAQFLFTLYMYYMLYGQALVYKRKTRRAIYAFESGKPIYDFLEGAVAGVHVIPNANWTLREDPYQGDIQAFDLNVRDDVVGVRVSLTPQECVYWHDFDPRYINGAISMASLAINNAISNAAIARWAAHYFMSGAMPLLLISTEQDPNIATPTDKQQLKSFVERAWQGLMGRFSMRAVWTDRKLSVQEAGITADKVQAPEINADALRAICSVFQISPDLIVPPEGGSQARHEVLVKQAYDTAVLPMAKQFLSVLNEAFGLNGTDIRLVIDETSIRALEADRQDKAGTEVSVFQAGGMRYSEFQSRLNLEPIPELSDFIMINNELKSVERVLREDKFVSDKLLSMAQQAWDSDGILRSEYRSFLGLKTPVQMRDGFKTEVTTSGMPDGGQPPVPPDGGNTPGTPPVLPPAPQSPALPAGETAHIPDARQIPETPVTGNVASEKPVQDSTVIPDTPAGSETNTPAEDSAKDIPLPVDMPEEQPGPAPKFEFSQGTAITTLPPVAETPHELPEAAPPVYVVLDVAGDDLLDMMRSGLAELLGDAPIQWELPERWHITLAHIAECPEDKLQAAILSLPQQLDRLPVQVRSTVTFETPEGTCVALAAELDEALRNIQSKIAQAFSAQMLAVSPFHQPGAFTPHITMGHLPAGSYVMPLQASCIVEPTRLIVSRPEYQISYEIPFGRPAMPGDTPDTPAVDESADIDTLLANTYAERLKMKALVKAWAETGIAPDTSGGVVEAVQSALAGGASRQAVFSDALQAIDAGLFDDQSGYEGNPLTHKASQKSAGEELDAWERYTLKNGVTKASTRFEIKALPLSIENSVKAALSAGTGDKAAVKSVFADARKALTEATHVADTSEDTLAEWAERMKESGMDELLPPDETDTLTAE